MKILLLNPYYSYPENRYRFFRPCAPYNLLYIAAYLRKHDITCDIKELGIFDENKRIYNNGKVRLGVDDADILGLIIGYDIIGISSMYSLFYQDVREIIILIRKFNPNCKIIVGGNNASSDPNQFSDIADHVVVGEGEKAFLNIIEGKTTDKVCFEKLIENLDDIPFPAYDLIDFNKYHEHSNPYVMHKQSSGIISSRGCPNNCIYCTVRAVWGRTWRGRSPENVVDEMQYMIKTYGIKEFHFLDDSVSADPKRWEAILDLIIKRKLKIKWTTPNGIAYWTLNEKLLDKMKKAGCYRITFGIESGDPETREFIHKTYPLEKATTLIRHANRIGLWTISTNIIGFPYEDAMAMARTLEYNKLSGVDFACFYLLAPQPSSEVYEYFIKEKLFDYHTDPYLLDEQGCNTKTATREALQEVQKFMYKDFLKYRMKDYLLFPERLLCKIRSFNDLVYFIRLVGLGIKMFLRSRLKIKMTSKEVIYG